MDLAAGAIEGAGGVFSHTVHTEGGSRHSEDFPRRLKKRAIILLNTNFILDIRLAIASDAHILELVLEANHNIVVKGLDRL